MLNIHFQSYIVQQRLNIVTVERSINEVDMLHFSAQAWSQKTPHLSNDSIIISQHESLNAV